MNFSSARLFLALLQICTVCLALPSMADESSASPDDNGIYSAAVIPDALPVGRSFSPIPEEYRNLVPWGSSNLRYELLDENNEQYAEARSDRHPVVGVFKLPDLPPIVDAVVDFEYRVPDHIRAKELHLNLRVAGANKRYTMRLPVETGKWQREAIPFSDIVGGDRWRFGEPRLASSVEVGLLTLDGGPATLQFRSFNVYRVPSCWGPLPLPQLITVPADGLQRTFEISASTLRQAWIQVIAGSPLEVMVNGKTLGVAGLKNIDTGKWPSSSIPVAREFSLEGYLVAGRANTVVLRSSDSHPVDDNPVLCALGYTTQNGEVITRHVLVSDSHWAPKGTGNSGMPGVPLATARPYKGNEPGGWGPIVDIYPLRNARMWTSSSTAPHDATPLTAKQLSEKRVIWDSLRNKISEPALPDTEAAWRIAAPGGNGSSPDRWKLLTPLGEPYYFLGMQVIGLFPRENYHYYRTMMDRYPNETDYLADTLTQVKELGFNGIAPAATSEAALRMASSYGLTHFQFLGPAAGPAVKNFEGHAYPKWADPFNQTWRESYRRRAREFAAKWRDDPDMIGVFVHNELAMDGSVNGGSLIGYIYSPDCRAAFVSWLAKRYDNSVEKLRAAWSPELPAAAELTSFESAPDLNPASVRHLRASREVSAEEGHAAPRQVDHATGAVLTDLYDFAVYAMGVYADFMLETLRAELPGKLIASNRFMGNATDEMLAAWKNYDLIAWNVYPFSKWQAGLLSEGQLENLRRAHRCTGKPVILSEIGLQALDARLPNPSAQLSTQKQRGEEYTKLLRQVHEELPFVVGFVLFCWQNLSDTERQSWGLVDQNGQPYTDYAERVRSANLEFMKTLP